MVRLPCREIWPPGSADDAIGTGIRVTNPCPCTLYVSLHSLSLGYIADHGDDSPESVLLRIVWRQMIGIDDTDPDSRLYIPYTYDLCTVHIPRRRPPRACSCI